MSDSKISFHFIYIHTKCIFFSCPFSYNHYIKYKIKGPMIVLLLACQLVSICNNYIRSNCTLFYNIYYRTLWLISIALVKLFYFWIWTFSFFSFHRRRRKPSHHCVLFFCIFPAFVKPGSSFVLFTSLLHCSSGLSLVLSCLPSGEGSSLDVKLVSLLA